MKKMIRSFLLKLLKINVSDVLEYLPDKSSNPTENSVDLVETHDLSSDVIDVYLSIPLEIPHKTNAALKSKKLAIKKTKIEKPYELSSQEKQERTARDISEMMEVPFLALSKNRKNPIFYEKNDGENMVKVNVFPPSNGFVASIYDWDIILFVAGRIQKVINDSLDIPPRTIIVPRHEILKSLKRYTHRE